ncbi:Bromodomain-domain-containing protein [Obba rivulosa]|uniref:histone acetyltransferase n=1 Tax=Obba rivulosa TaxID=1052685 RepID=A0A8E2DP00_9APHY|nr:Bromodomain-domain-containing protein [Obba rivulosa]
MKALYPASHDIPRLSESQLALKIARHSRCAACDTCDGLRPPAGVEVSLDKDAELDNVLGGLNRYGSEDDEPPSNYLEACACGHSAANHGADPSLLGRDEFARRGRVGVRIDELLQDKEELLNFDYSDEDIDSLRQQMQLPASSPSSISDGLASLLPSTPDRRPISPASSFLSDGFDQDPDHEPPAKKRRISFSSLSDADEDDDDDEEDKPLAARMGVSATATKTRPENGPRTNQRSGKQMTSKKSVAHTAPVSIMPPTAREREGMTVSANGANGHSPKVKVEDKMDESQLTRLATGVTFDANGAASATQPGVKPEKAAHAELQRGIIRIVPVENDGQPQSLILLTGLKTLFQKQLPKMPREYIARLVYDSNSRCLAIVKRGLKVVSGICFRPFPQRGFAEIVFFATTSVDQVKGYGGMLMDNFKQHIKETYPGMMHFLTYADNYAVGYFRKQGFSKDITLDRSVWAGYIKDYEGGTIMQCTMLRKVNYLEARDLVAQQREAILSKIREKSRSHIVYNGLPQFREGEWDGRPLDPKDIPGLRESGWTPSMAALVSRPSGKSAERTAMEKLLSDLQGHGLSWPFLQPVNGDEVVDYYEVIKKPMDFSTMEHKLDTNQYPNIDAFLADAQLVFDNCRTYNPDDSIYHKNATKLERFLKDQLKVYQLKTEE